MNLISFDPGVTTGWAKFTESTVPTEFGEASVEQLYDWLNDDGYWSEWHPNQVVVEDYLIRPIHGNAHDWSRSPTIQCIGAVQCWARRWHAPVHLSPAALLAPGAKRFGLPDPKNRSLKNRNAISAIVHGRIFFEQRGVRYLGDRTPNGPR